MADRYEARVLPGSGRALTLWGAWDTKHHDWVRRLGTGAGAGHPEVFTSVERVQLWAKRATEGEAVASSAHRAPGRSQ